MMLILIASVSLSACQSSPKRSREVYRNLSDCSLEWGGAEKCEQVQDGLYPVGYYYGPYYRNINGKVYYSDTHNRSLLVPANAGILKNPQAQPILSVREDICAQKRIIPETGEIVCDHENTSGGSRSYTNRNRQFNYGNGYAAPSSGRVSRGGFGSTARGGSIGS
ncbi:MAG: hypothetical protein F6J89_02920 [Symploca sp. SIO1C4]|uniref:Uncharacterized protein n=1 Tax=Symploca sp. SIO1C4 TaxID=2607765 RepID=A0A6B3N7I6_9CYAN|nr:hypothetical protein [Symploca sp. SIO1C4]